MSKEVITFDIETVEKIRGAFFLLSTLALVNRLPQLDEINNLRRVVGAKFVEAKRKITEKENEQKDQQTEGRKMKKLYPEYMNSSDLKRKYLAFWEVPESAKDVEEKLVFYNANRILHEKAKAFRGQPRFEVQKLVNVVSQDDEAIEFIAMESKDNGLKDIPCFSFSEYVGKYGNGSRIYGYLSIDSNVVFLPEDFFYAEYDMDDLPK